MSILLTVLIIIGVGASLHAFTHSLRRAMNDDASLSWSAISERQRREEAEERERRDKRRRNRGGK